MRLKCSLWFLCLAWLAAGSVQGQFAQYTQPGSGAEAPAAVDEETLDQAIENARWNAGPLYVEPWVGLRRVTWNTNPFGRTEDREIEGDLTATVAAGLQAYLPTGPDVVWTVHAVPEYTWWADQDERRRLNGRYGVSGYGFFNRLTLEAGATRSDEQGIVSYEIPVEVSTRRDRGRGSVSLELGAAIALFAEGSVTRSRNEIDEEDRLLGAGLGRLDNTERRARAGIRYEPRDRWRFGVGVERTETELEQDARNLSNSGEAPLLEIVYTGARTTFTATAAFRSLDADEGSDFQSTETTTYSLRGELRGNRIQPALYANRSLGLALDENQSHFERDLAGLALGVPIGRRTRLQVFGELGRLDFEPIADGTPDREDDVTGYGIGFTMTLGPRFQLRLGGSRTELDSNLPGLDREVTTIDAGITFTSGPLRLL
ncbi:MAG: hypothetical protein PVG07_15900 [Acidobacteriota bacterium]|jgi:hypothetical protein